MKKFRDSFSEKFFVISLNFRAFLGLGPKIKFGLISGSGPKFPPVYNSV